MCLALLQPKANIRSPSLEVKGTVEQQHPFLRLLNTPCVCTRPGNRFPTTMTNSTTGYSFTEIGAIRKSSNLIITVRNRRMHSFPSSHSICHKVILHFAVMENPTISRRCCCEKTAVQAGILRPPNFNNNSIFELPTLWLLLRWTRSRDEVLASYDALLCLYESAAFGPYLRILHKAHTSFRR